MSKITAEMAKHIADEIERTHGEQVNEEFVRKTIKRFMQEKGLKFTKEIGD